MIVKFFKGKHSSVNDGIDYLLGSDKNRKVAPLLLSGNPSLTREHLKAASKFKKAYTYGCLSFEEKNIPFHQKQELMQSFERTLLAGLEPEQYDIIWVEHTDKDRLELNFHIVNMELTSQKSFTPYVHRRDLGRVDAWKNLANDSYGFSNPNDPEKKRTITFGDNPPPRKEIMQNIDEYIFDLALDGEVSSQAEIVAALNAVDGVEVSRTTKKSISIKMEGQQKPIRLKGEIYAEHFKGAEQLQELQEERTREFQQQRKERINKNRRDWQSRLTRISEQRANEYPNRAKEGDRYPDVAVSIDADRRGDTRKLPDNEVPKHSLQEVSGGRPEQGEQRDLLQNKITNYANNNNETPNNITPRILELFAKIGQAIERIAGRTQERKAEARALGEEYQRTQRNCNELNQLLKNSGIQADLIHDSAFEAALSDEDKALINQATQAKPKPQAKNELDGSRKVRDRGRGLKI